MEPANRNLWLSFGTLLTSLTTLVCCVLPAVLVALGAGVVVVGLVTAVPQLVLLSERKELVFGIAAGMLALSGLALWRGRQLPCPADPRLAAHCLSIRRTSHRLYVVSLVLVAAGAFAAFGLPLLSQP